MITEIGGETAKKLLKDRHDVFSLKIGALLRAYDGYDFCRMYGGENILIGKYYDELVIRTEGEITDDSAEELGLFLNVCGYRQAICGYETGKRLAESGGVRCFESILFKFSGEHMPKNELVPDFGKLTENPPLDTVFPIVKDGFPNIVYENWYTDISHKIRHGVSKTYVFGGATATVMSETEKAAFTSLVATKNEARRKGDAKNLLRSLGLHYEAMGKEMSILCRRELIPFYKKAGFYQAGAAMNLSPGQ